MCVVCAKAKGVARPTNEQINTMMTNNPDGFGLATFENGQIVVKKTMKKKTYLKWCKQVDDDTPAIFHMRIATHGSVSEKNCHPFLSDDGKWAFAHNGILSIKNENDMTDSETFFRRIALPILNNGYDIDSTEFKLMINSIIGSSKFAFMDNKGHISLFGNWIENNGLFFSNTSYEPKVYDLSGFWDKWSTPESSKQKTCSYDSKWWKKKDDVNEVGSDSYCQMENELWDIMCTYEYLSPSDAYGELKMSFPELKWSTFEYVYASVESYFYDKELDKEEFYAQ